MFAQTQPFHNLLTLFDPVTLYLRLRHWRVVSDLYCGQAILYTLSINRPFAHLHTYKSIFDIFNNNIDQKIDYGGTKI